MEISISDEAATAIGSASETGGYGSETEKKISALVRAHIGFPSIVVVSLARNPDHVEISGAGKTVTVDRQLTHRVEQYC